MKRIYFIISLTFITFLSINAQDAKVLSIKETATVLLKEKVINKDEFNKIDSINIVLNQDRRELDKRKSMMSEDEIKKQSAVISKNFTNTLKEILGTERFNQWQKTRYSK